MLPPALRATDQHPFVGLDVPALLAWRAQTRRDHPFIVWSPFEGEGKPGPTASSTTASRASPAAWRGAACAPANAY